MVRSLVLFLVVLVVGLLTTGETLAQPAGVAGTSRVAHVQRDEVRASAHVAHGHTASVGQDDDVDDDGGDDDYDAPDDDDIGQPVAAVTVEPAAPTASISPVDAAGLGPASAHASLLERPPRNVAS